MFRLQFTYVRLQNHILLTNLKFLDFNVIYIRGFKMEARFHKLKYLTLLQTEYS